MYFSEREKIIPEKEIVIGTIEERCSNRIWNEISYLFEYITENDYRLKDIPSFIKEIILDRHGKIIHGTGHYINVDSNLRKLWFNEIEWNEKFDIVEIILTWLSKVEFNELELFVAKLNNILIEEKSGYRIMNNIIVPIISTQEMEELKIAINNPYETVSQSLEKALLFYSDRVNPDYKNSIKESITAVESMCCIICNQNNATLGQAFGKLESKGVYIHGAMRSGFGSLYGYTSNSTGIRHGGIEETKVTAEDAKYMLVSCSAFVNYLKEKYSKIQGE